MCRYPEGRARAKKVVDLAAMLGSNRVFGSKWLVGVPVVPSRVPSDPIEPPLPPLRPVVM